MKTVITREDLWRNGLQAKVNREKAQNYLTQVSFITQGIVYLEGTYKKGFTRRILKWGPTIVLTREGLQERTYDNTAY